MNISTDPPPPIPATARAAIKARIEVAKPQKIVPDPVTVIRLFSLRNSGLLHQIKTGLATLRPCGLKCQLGVLCKNNGR